MKITAPVTSAVEAARLISCGAGELYCGLHPGAWRKNYGNDVWANRRGPGVANITDLSAMNDVVKTAHRQGVPVFLTLNLPFYPPELYPEIVSMAGEVVAGCGVDALIIGDPGLMLAIKEAMPGVDIHVSSLAAVLNSSAASFFRDLGVTRIIFPRYMVPGDIKTIIDIVGRGIEYEVFILNDGCVFEEGYCQVNHAFGGAFCHRPWLYELQGRENISVFEKDSFRRHMSDYMNLLWFIKNCGGHPGPGGYPLGMCGICALPELKDAGVVSLKIVGRESPVSKKRKSVKLVKKALEYLDTHSDADQFRAMVKKTRNTPSLCSSGLMCYFR